MSSKCLSLCIPTNGITEWVLPVLDSIYNNQCNNDDFEVIVTDNGSNNVFEKAMVDYSVNHPNLIYKKTSAYLFMNQIEAFKLATGDLIKFVNHRMLLLPGALEYLMSFSKEHNVNKPVVYFSNGKITSNGGIFVCDSFDEFVLKMSYWSSWSAGIAIWRTAFNHIIFEDGIESLFPHLSLLFSNYNSHFFIIDNKLIMKEQIVDESKKGNYDLFHAFAVDFPSQIENLYINGRISKETYDSVLCDTCSFVNNLYYDYIVRKRPCSYDLSGLKKSYGVYFTKKQICGGSCKRIITGLYKRIKKYLRNE